MKWINEFFYCLRFEENFLATNDRSSLVDHSLTHHNYQQFIQQLTQIVSERESQGELTTLPTTSLKTIELRSQSTWRSETRFIFEAILSLFARHFSVNQADGDHPPESIDSSVVAEEYKRVGREFRESMMCVLFSHSAYIKKKKIHNF